MPALLAPSGASLPELADVPEIDSRRRSPLLRGPERRIKVTYIQTAMPSGCITTTATRRSCAPRSSGCAGSSATTRLTPLGSSTGAVSATECTCRATRRPARPAHRPQRHRAAGATRASASSLSARSRLSSSGVHPCRQRGIVPALGDDGPAAMVWILDDDMVHHLVGARRARAAPASAPARSTRGLPGPPAAPPRG